MSYTQNFPSTSWGSSPSPVGTSSSYGRTLGALGYGVQGLSSYMGGQAQAAGYVGGKTSAEFASAEAKRRGQYGSWRSLLGTKRTLGSQRNALGVAGIEMEGTAIDILAETAKELTLDRIMELRNARVESYGQSMAAKDYGRAASAAKSASTIGAIGAGIGAAGLLFSDARCKQGIVPITDALARVRQLAAKQYKYIGSDIECIGLIAQDIEKVLPEAVKEQDGLKLVDVYAIQSLIISAINELRAA